MKNYLIKKITYMELGIVVGRSKFKAVGVLNYKL